MSFITVYECLLYVAVLFIYVCDVAIVFLPEGMLQLHQVDSLRLFLTYFLYFRCDLMLRFSK